MDSDDELTEEDLLILDAEAQRLLENCNNSSNRTVQDQSVRESAETSETVDDADFAYCFEDDGEPEMEALEILKSKFRHPCFRAKQWQIIKSLRERRDVCAVMATGYGKSLCFQFLAVYTNKITLVISPLIALMQAQVIDLQTAGISACLVGTAQKDPKILDRIAAGQFRIIYSSPEFLQTWNGGKLLSIIADRLALVAIDEAHCVSQWGHDFRPDFRKLHIIREKFPTTPILAVTATATENVRYDIITLLGLKEPKVIMTSFDRTNLELTVKRKTSVKDDILPLMKDVDGSVIVYVLKRKDAEDISQELKDQGLNCDHYHAGLNIPKRTEVLDKFLKDELRVIVATIAFGMGIDKKDIRCVIHYGASKNLESYYQEVGRAGRDGKPAKVITFFSPDDFELHDWFMEVESTKNELSAVIKNYLRSLAAKMRDYLYSTQCRRKIILEYFGEKTVLSPRPHCCDNCTIGLGSWRLTDLYEDVDAQGIYDFSVKAKILMEAIKCLTLHSISTEKSLLKKFLVGKYDQRLQRVQHDRCYASGRSHSQQYWLALTEQLTQNEYIDMVPNGKMLALTPKAENWLKNAVNLRLKAIGQMFEYFRRKPSTPLVVVSNETDRYTVTRAVTDLLRRDYVLSGELLKQILSDVRDAISECKSITDKNSIASMVDLDKMVKARPVNLDEFRFALGSFSEEKLNRFGPTFANAVSKFTNAELEMQNVLLNHPIPNVRMDHVVSPQILRLLKERKTKEEILQSTNLTERQLFDDIATLIQTGQPVIKTDIAYLSHIDFKIFSRLIPKTTIDITTIEQVDEMAEKYFHSTSERIDSGFVRLALVYHDVRLHLNRVSVAYVDCEENVLVNAQELIVAERKEKLNTDFKTDRQYAPYRQNYCNAQSFIDLLFGNFAGYVSYGESQFDYDMDHDEHFGSDDNAESSDRDDDGIEEEENEESDEESEQESEDEDGSAVESEEESATDNEESATDTSDSSDSEGDSDSDFDSEGERDTYGRKRRRIN